MAQALGSYCKLIVVGLLVFLSYACSIHYWQFLGEDYGSLLRGSFLDSRTTIYETFKYGDFSGTTDHISTKSPHGPESVHRAKTFFQCFYRPLLVIFYWLEYKIFKLQPYAYFLCAIGLHSLNVMLVAYLLLKFLPFTSVFLAALYFGMHPTLGSWLGKVDMTQNIINLLLILITLCLFIDYVNKQQKHILLSIGLTFLAALFLRETYIITPIVPLFALFLFKKEIDPSLRKNIITLFWILSIAVGIYLAVRFAAYPRISLTVTYHQGYCNTQSSFISIFGTKLLQVARGIYDAFWLQWFPWTFYDFCKTEHLLPLNKILKSAIVCMTTHLFMKSSEKKLIFAMLITVGIVVWPIYLNSGALRFYYEALPLIVAVIAILITSKISYNWVKNCYLTLLALIVVFNFSNNIKALKNLRSYGEEQLLAIQTLQRGYADILKTSKIIILNSPSICNYIGSNFAQGIQLLGLGNVESLCCWDWLRLKNPGKNASNFIITKKNNTFCLKSFNKQSWIEISEHDSTKILESFTIVKKEGAKIFELEFSFRDEDSAIIYLLSLEDHKTFLKLD